MAGYLYDALQSEDDDWLLTESGDSLTTEPVGITCEVQAGWQNALLSTEDDDWLTTEAGDGLTTEQAIGPVGIAQGVATFRLAGSVVATGPVGSATGQATIGEAEPEIPDWLWGMHLEAAHRQNLKLRPLVGKVAAHGVAGTAQGVASFRTSADLLNDLLAKPRIDAQFEMDVRAIAAGLNIGLPETLAQADLEPVWLLLMDSWADG